MSYDISLMMDTGGPELVMVESWNYTSNCAPMWRLAGADLADFEGKTSAECLPSLKAAINVMAGDPARFKAMNPPNGWGDYDSLLKALTELAESMSRNPLTVVCVWR